MEGKIYVITNLYCEGDWKVIDTYAESDPAKVKTLAIQLMKKNWEADFPEPFAPDSRWRKEWDAAEEDVDFNACWNLHCKLYSAQARSGKIRDEITISEVIVGCDQPGREVWTDFPL